VTASLCALRHDDVCPGFSRTGGLRDLTGHVHGKKASVVHALHIVVESLVRTGPGKRHDRWAGLQRCRKIRFIGQEEQKVHPKRLRRCRTNGRDPFAYLNGTLAGDTEGPQSSSVRDSRYQRH